MFFQCTYIFLVFKIVNYYLQFKLLRLKKPKIVHRHLYLCNMIIIETPIYYISCEVTRKRKQITNLLRPLLKTHYYTHSNNMTF